MGISYMRSGIASFSRMVETSRRMVSTHSRSPIRLVLFDVFDTLCTPRLPIHIQYHEEALKAGIPSSSISPDSIRAGFKPAFKEMDSRWPLYGKKSDPVLTPEEWWTQLIRRCMINAGASEVEIEGVIDKLGPALLSRFESDRGYKSFPETIQCLDDLKQLGVKTSIVSNADPRILHTLRSLGILDRITHPPTLSWNVEHSKPHSAIFNAACEACGEESGVGVLMVGDELKADYRGAVEAGLEGRLIRRTGEWSDGAKRKAEEDLSDVHIVESLTDVVEEVKRRNGA